MEKCGTFVDAVQDTLVLAFEVADKTILDSPAVIRTVLEDPAIRSAIERAALGEAKRLTAAQKAGKAVTEADVSKSLTSVATAAQGAALENVKRQIEGSSEFKKLMKEVQNLGCAFKQSPTGVFVDKNKGWLILVGAGLGIGGATALYMFRSGDFAAGPAANLAGKHLRFRVLGNVDIGAKKITFVPSSRQVATTMFASAKWDKVNVRLDLSVEFKEEHLQSAGGAVTTDVTVAKGLVLTGTGTAGYQSGTKILPPSLVYNLGLGVTFKNAFGQNKLDLSARAFVDQSPTSQKAGGALNAKINLFRLPDQSSINLGVTGEVSNTHLLDPSPKPDALHGLEYKGMLMLEWKHDIFGK